MRVVGIRTLVNRGPVYSRAPKPSARINGGSLIFRSRAFRSVSRSSISAIDIGARARAPGFASAGQPSGGGWSGSTTKRHSIAEVVFTWWLLETSSTFESSRSVCSAAIASTILGLGAPTLASRPPKKVLRSLYSSRPMPSVRNFSCTSAAVRSVRSLSTAAHTRSLKPASWAARRRLSSSSRLAVLRKYSSALQPAGTAGSSAATTRDAKSSEPTHPAVLHSFVWVSVWLGLKMLPDASSLYLGVVLSTRIF